MNCFRMGKEFFELKSKAVWECDFREAVQFGYHCAPRQMTLPLHIIGTSIAIQERSFFQKDTSSHCHQINAPQDIHAALRCWEGPCQSHPLPKELIRRSEYIGTGEAAHKGRRNRGWPIYLRSPAAAGIACIGNDDAANAVGLLGYGTQLPVAIPPCGFNE